MEDNTKSGVLRPVIIPVIKKKIPTILTEQMQGMHPMPDSGKTKYKFTYSFNERQRRYKQGEVAHSFTDGFLAYYGTEWIPYEVYLRLRTAGL